MISDDEKSHRNQVEHNDGPYFVFVLDFEKKPDVKNLQKKWNDHQRHRKQGHQLFVLEIDRDFVRKTKHDKGC